MKVLHDAGNGDKALKVIEELLQIHPFHVKATLTKATIHGSLKQHKQVCILNNVDNITRVEMVICATRIIVGNE